MRRDSILFAVAASLAFACAGAPPPLPAPAAPVATAHEPPSSAPPSPAPTPTSAASAERPGPAAAPSGPETDESGSEVAALEPPGTASPLEGAAGFAAVRSGKALHMGDRGPAVTVVQAMLVLWNYPLDVAQITGRFDETTAVAVLHYRIDAGLDTFKGSGEKAFAVFAHAHGAFDAATLRSFEGRLRAKMYRTIREIDLQRGFRFQFPAKTSKAAALAALFPEEDARRAARDAGTEVLFDAPDARGEVASWVSLKGYGCASASRLRAACR